MFLLTKKQYGTTYYGIFSSIEKVLPVLNSYRYGGDTFMDEHISDWVTIPPEEVVTLARVTEAIEDVGSFTMRNCQLIRVHTNNKDLTRG